MIEFKLTNTDKIVLIDNYDLCLILSHNEFWSANTIGHAVWRFF